LAFTGKTAFFSRSKKLVISQYLFGESPELAIYFGYRTKNGLAGEAAGGRRRA
jgi:hypothetical protein